MAAVTAFAQSDVTSRLEECAALEIDSERLACYDRLNEVETGRIDTAEGDDTTEGDQSEAPPAPPAVSAEVTGSAVETAPPSDPALAPATDTSARPVPATAPVSRDEERVHESSRASEDPAAITIVSMRRNLSGFTVFETEAGEQWIQTDLTNRRYPPVPFNARIERALLHGYFLRVEDGGIRIRVRMLQ